MMCYLMDVCGCGRKLQRRTLENFLSLWKRNCLPQLHSENATHLNEPLRAYSAFQSCTIKYFCLRNVKTLMNCRQKSFQLPIDSRSIKSILARMCQVDSVTRWLSYFFNIWQLRAINICPKYEIFAKVDLQFCQILNSYSRKGQTLLKLCLSGTILPNLVTLQVCKQMFISLSYSQMKKVFYHFLFFDILRERERQRQRDFDDVLS